MAKYPIGLLEEELKNKVAADWFAAYDTTRIVNQWRANRAASGDVDAWMDANAANRAWNACAIVTDKRYLWNAQSSGTCFLRRQGLFR